MATKPVSAPPRAVRQPVPKPSPAKAKVGGNGSILNFFHKAEPAPPPETDENLFVSDDEGERAATGSSKDGMTGSVASGLNSRFNEAGGSLKRRRLSNPPTEEAASAGVSQQSEPAKRPILQNLGFLNQRLPVGDLVKEPGPADEDCASAIEQPVSGKRPALLHESTSAFDDSYDGIEDFADEEFPVDGEEAMERRYMEEQRLMELEFESDDEGGASREDLELRQRPSSDAHVPSCPVCGCGLPGLDDAQASQHVNDCLDGKTTDVPPDAAAAAPSSAVTETPAADDGDEPAEKPKFKRFQRAAIARPAQANPFALDGAGGGMSAFSKLMASHAEDSAWATAAANEVASRGKPAFKRTCPFYKILPGFSICVDAFRYGAVEGCSAYFLSHFHSDHYIGLTSTWCHGPIYCSRVTGNLVRQQLRVDPRWVVDLEWERETEVPRTGGVRVTMIPANHCPGSSLFLFEKEAHRGGSGGGSRLQRVLHCGDFRACAAHVQHPLLRPDVLDAATGKSRQQKLDVCYLDTTYLTPKYAFPPQDEVIQACADMCASLSQDRPDVDPSWAGAKRQHEAAGMAKFVTKAADAGGGGGQARQPRGRLLVVVGTYSIGKERICLGIARALDSKIFAPPGKQRICAALEDPELAARLTGDPLAAQVHMQMLMEIRAETLADYLAAYRPHFSRVVGFRPSGWNYRPPAGRLVDSPLVQTVLHSPAWRPGFSVADLAPQRGSSRDASCFGVPYSEHSSFRELTMFCCALRIDRIIPTVNVGSAKSREKMKAWIERWSQDKRKHGLFKVADDATAW